MAGASAAGPEEILGAPQDVGQTASVHPQRVGLIQREMVQETGVYFPLLFGLVLDLGRQQLSSATRPVMM